MPKKRQKTGVTNATAEGVILNKRAVNDQVGTQQQAEETAPVAVPAGPRGKGRETPGLCDNPACAVTSSKQWRRGPLVCPRLCNPCGTRFNRSKDGKEQAFFVWMQSCCKEQGIEVPRWLADAAGSQALARLAASTADAPDSAPESDLPQRAQRTRFKPKRYSSEDSDECHFSFNKAPAGAKRAQHAQHGNAEQFPGPRHAKRNNMRPKSDSSDDDSVPDSWRPVSTLRQEATFEQKRHLHRAMPLWRHIAADYAAQLMSLQSVSSSDQSFLTLVQQQQQQSKEVANRLHSGRQSADRNQQQQGQEVLYQQSYGKQAFDKQQQQDMLYRQASCRLPVDLEQQQQGQEVLYQQPSSRQSYNLQQNQQQGGEVLYQQPAGKESSDQQRRHHSPSLDRQQLQEQSVEKQQQQESVEEQQQQQSVEKQQQESVRKHKQQQDLTSLARHSPVSLAPFLSPSPASHVAAQPCSDACGEPSSPASHVAAQPCSDAFAQHSPSTEAGIDNQESQALAGARQQGGDGMTGQQATQLLSHRAAQHRTVPNCAGQPVSGTLAWHNLDDKAAGHVQATVVPQHRAAVPISPFQHAQQDARGAQVAQHAQQTTSGAQLPQHAQRSVDGAQHAQQDISGAQVAQHAQQDTSGTQLAQHAQQDTSSAQLARHAQQDTSGTQLAQHAQQDTSGAQLAQHAQQDTSGCELSTAQNAASPLEELPVQQLADAFHNDHVQQHDVQQHGHAVQVSSALHGTAPQTSSLQQLSDLQTAHVQQHSANSPQSRSELQQGNSNSPGPYPHPQQGIANSPKPGPNLRDSSLRFLPCPQQGRSVPVQCKSPEIAANSPEIAANRAASQLSRDELWMAHTLASFDSIDEGNWEPRELPCTFYDGELPLSAEQDQRAAVRGRNIKMPSRFADTDAAAAAIKSAPLAASSGKRDVSAADKDKCMGDADAGNASVAAQSKRAKRARDAGTVVTEGEQNGIVQTKRRRVAAR